MRNKRPPLLTSEQIALLTPEEKAERRRAQSRYTMEVKRLAKSNNAGKRKEPKISALAGKEVKNFNKNVIGLYSSAQCAALHRGGSIDTFEAYVGCSVSDFKAHIESLWHDGMTWENHSREGWHIDHIRPLSTFNLLDKKQRFAAFHYTNTQPLWASDNILKKDKWDGKTDHLPRFEIGERKRPKLWHSKVSREHGKVISIGAGSKFENPFNRRKHGDASQCQRWFEERLRSSPPLLSFVKEMDGVNLRCFCDQNACHGEVIMSLWDELNLEESQLDLFA